MAERQKILLKDSEPVESLSAYLATGGFQALKKALGMTPAAIVSEIKQSGLRGRGGAGFPTGIKWEGVINANVDFPETLNAGPGPGTGWDAVYPAVEDLHLQPAKKFLCCNCAEGEPGTYKDRFVIRRNPYQLLEGMAIAAHAIGAAQSYLCIKEIFVKEIAIMGRAIEECLAQGYLGKNVMGSGINIPLQLAQGPDSYLFGEDRALLEVVEGKPAWPRLKGVIPVHFGLYGHPTLVNNVETLCHVTHIFRNGAAWFKGIGSADTPGTTCITLSGDIKTPGVYEVPTGTTLKTLIYEYGGGPKGKRVKAVFSGPTNAVITEDRIDTPLDFGSMKKMGSGLGSGGFIVYDETACIVKAGLNFSKFLALESCGQCPSCKTGTARITEGLERVENGTATEDDVLAIAEECRAVKGQGHCFLITEEAVNISSILHYFTEEVFDHLEHGCKLPRPLILPKIKDYDAATHTFRYDLDYYQHAVELGENIWLKIDGKIDPLLFAGKRKKAFSGLVSEDNGLMGIVIQFRRYNAEVEKQLAECGFQKRFYYDTFQAVGGVATPDAIKEIARLEAVRYIKSDRGAETINELLVEIRSQSKTISPSSKPVH
jgi:NADH-quinone oxidoreductase subunit F